MTPARILLGGALLIASANVASSAVLCQARGDHLVVREACRKHEHRVDPAALGVAGPTGPAGADGAMGGPASFPLRLLDTNGVEVGPILHFYPGQALVEIHNPSLPSPLLLFLYPQGFAQETNRSLLYASNDCSGAPFMSGVYQDPHHVHPPRAITVGLAAYYAAGGAQPLTYASDEFQPVTPPCPAQTTDTGRGTCCSAHADQAFNVSPMVRVPLSLFGLTPPFHAVPR